MSRALARGAPDVRDYLPEGRALHMEIFTQSLTRPFERHNGFAHRFPYHRLEWLEALRCLYRLNKPRGSEFVRLLHVFDPDPETLDKVGHRARPPLPLPNIRHDADGNFGGIALSEEYAENTLAVHKLALDDLLHLPRLRLLKADVEGMEIDVLRGCEQTIQRLRPLIYVENDRPDTSESLIRLISAMGYALHWHIVPLFNTRNYAGISENVFPGIVSFNMLAAPAELNARIVGLLPVADPTDHPLREGTRLRNLQ